MFHGRGNDGGYSPVSTGTLQGCIDYMDKNRDTFWVESFGNVARYSKERDAVSVKELSNNELSITLKVSDDLNDEIFNYPLSIQRHLPAKWNTAKVTQNNKPVLFSFNNSNGKKVITFDVIPDRGRVIISKGAVRAVKKTGSILTGSSNFKIVLNNRMLPVMVPGYGSIFRIELFTPYGVKIAGTTIYTKIGMNSLFYFVASGMYIVNISNDKTAFTNTYIVP